MSRLLYERVRFGYGWVHFRRLADCSEWEALDVAAPGDRKLRVKRGILGSGSPLSDAGLPPNGTVREFSGECVEFQLGFIIIKTIVCCTVGRVAEGLNPSWEHSFSRKCAYTITFYFLRMRRGFFLCCRPGARGPLSRARLLAGRCSAFGTAAESVTRQAISRRLPLRVRPSSLISESNFISLIFSRWVIFLR